MTEPTGEAAILGIVGAVILTAHALRTALARLGLPAMAGYVAIGLSLSAADVAWGVVPPGFDGAMALLSSLGVVVLMFRVGLESDLDLLLGQLGRAAVIWLPNMALPGALAFCVVYWWPGFDLASALFAGVAASATSIGVATATWEEAGMLRSPEGALLVDVAELDDLSAVVLMSLLFAVAPVLAATGQVPWSAALSAVGEQFGKLVVFCTACYLFSRYAERCLTAWFARRDHRTGPLLFATATALLIAAVADLAGFSLAIGALFAGLAFSRDPAERRIDRAFAGLFHLFGPFFFVAIGLAVDVTALGDAAGLALALLAAAVLGKLIGAGLPTAYFIGARSGLLVGLSMVPRAEIFLIVMAHGLAAGAIASTRLYDAGVLVALATSLLGAVAVGAMLSRRAMPRRTA